LAGESGDARKALEKIQCDTLARKQPRRRPRDVSKVTTLGDCIAVTIGTLEGNLLRDVMKAPDHNRPARQYEVLLGNELSTSLHVGTDDRLSCDVTEAQILLESGRNDGV
jgi:hypothetical protein